MSRSQILALVCLSASLMACSNSQFAGLGNRSKADKQEESGEIKGGEKTSQTNKKEEEQDLDDPQQVAGSFLTLECVEDIALPHDSEHVTVGCVVKDSEGKKADLSAATDQQWQLVSPLNFPVTTTFVEEPAKGEYHRTLQAPKLFLELHSVRAAFKKDGLDRELVDTVSPATSEGNASNEPPPAPVEIPVVEIGQTEDFQLGDDNWDASANPGCVDRLQDVNISGQSITAVLHVKSATANVGISLKDMCGVTYRTNGAKLYKDGKEVIAARIKRYATELALPGTTLQQGDYELKIESGTDDDDWHHSDHDDFIIGKIVVASDGDVTLDRPTAPAETP